MLFIPANRSSWIERAPSYGADAIILDLEDSVPAGDKAMARANAAAKIADLRQANQRVYVRINRSKFIYDFDDIAAVARQGVEGIMLPKPGGIEDIALADAMIGEAEHRAGLAPGTIALAPVLETARAIVKAFEIASHPRVAFIVAASAKNGDVARSLGFQWSAEGLETLYLRSSAIAAARAAGKVAVGGLWQDVHDLEGLRNWVNANRQLGFSGELALHPSNVLIINEIHTPSVAEVTYYTGMIAAFEAAERDGRGALIYEGDHVDKAHVSTAREIIALMQDLNAK
jgi:citrate lyase subunit beta/citryl-CoA lyase